MSKEDTTPNLVYTALALMLRYIANAEDASDELRSTASDVYRRMRAQAKGVGDGVEH